MKIFCEGTLDIKFQGDHVYYLKKNPWNSKEIEIQIETIQYKGNGLSRNSIAENSKFPPYILHFYKMIFQNGKIPTPEEFLNSYYESFFEQIDSERVKIKEECFRIGDYGFKKDAYIKEGITNRFYRTYPSLLRDFHFLILAEEQGLFDSVSYSLNTDFFGGYDILVKYQDKEYGVSIYVETSRGNHYKKKKVNRHEYEKYKEIELPINLKECKMCGEIYLLTNRHVEQVLKLIEQAKEKENG